MRRDRVACRDVTDVYYARASQFEALSGLCRHDARHQRILVPLDFSTNSNGALEYAHGLATRFDAALHLVHVCEIPPMPRGKLDVFGIAYTDWATHFTEEARKQLDQVAAGINGQRSPPRCSSGTCKSRCRSGPGQSRRPDCHGNSRTWSSDAHRHGERR